MTSEIISEDDIIQLTGFIDNVSDEQIVQIINDIYDTNDQSNNDDYLLKDKKDMTSEEKQRYRTRIYYYTHREENIKRASDYYYNNKERILAQKKGKKQKNYRNPTGRKVGRPRKQIPEFIKINN